MTMPTERARGDEPVTVEVQVAVDSETLPGRDDLARWVRAALAGRWDRPAEVTIRLVDAEESAGLNRRYRRRQGATNVLSFPYEAPPGIPDLPLLGDLVICAPVVDREAGEQRKTREAHWAHMVVHGTLHLLGFDHQTPGDAATMETLETCLLERLGFPDPYREEAPLQFQTTRDT